MVATGLVVTGVVVVGGCAVAVVVVDTDGALAAVGVWSGTVPPNSRTRCCSVVSAIAQLMPSALSSSEPAMIMPTV